MLGNRKLDVGYYSKKKLDQICEGIQRRKFLTLVNTLTISLFNAVLCNKMELGKGILIKSIDVFTNFDSFLLRFDSQANEHQTILPIMIH